MRKTTIAAPARQITIGEAIQMMKVCTNDTVIIDFPGRVVSRLVSWRGDYSEASIHTEEWGGAHNPPRRAEFVKYLENAVGDHMVGYKGGSYLIRADTPLWADPYGTCDNLAVTSVQDYLGACVISTAVCDYYRQ